MKIITRLAVVALLLFCFTNTQAQKFGHINSNDLLDAMPEVKVADSALQAYQKSLEDLNESMVKEYSTKLADYQSHPEWSDEKKQITEAELTDLQDRIQKFQSDAQDKFAAKKDALYSPILKKADDAIKAVAKENNYAYVFDTGVGAVLYAQDSDNIMDLVKKKLGLK
ncbi:MAG TPA: hypothetical protein DCQ93_05990 [Bacteroidetes bacterium]|nr:hypothetical protein [Bacteroidota bacterium]